MRVLLVEDEFRVASVISDMLAVNGFVVDAVNTLGDASEAVAVVSYDALLLDRKLPDGDGLDWLRAKRRLGWSAPTIILTAEMESVEDRIDGLNSGADDYVLKPMNMDELVARLRAVLRRPAKSLVPILNVGNIEFDPASRQVWIGGNSVKIARREVSLLEFFLRRPGRIITRAMLEEKLFSYDDEVSPNALEVGIYRLRSRLSRGGATVTISTARGIGYVLETVVMQSKPSPDCSETPAQLANDDKNSGSIGRGTRKLPSSLRPYAQLSRQNAK